MIESNEEEIKTWKWKKTPIEKESKVIEEEKVKYKTMTEKDKAIILEERINTWESAQLIADRLGFSERTVSRVILANMAEVGEKSKKAHELIDENNNLISKADKLLLKKLDDVDGNVRIGELVSLRESAYKQSQLLQNKPTENLNILWDVLKEIQGLNDK